MKRSAPRHVVRAVLETTWLMLPEKLEQITQFLEARVAGVRLTKEEVRAAFGFDDEDDEDDQPRTVNGVRILSLQGVLMPRANLFTRFSGGTSTQLLGQQFNKALADDNVKAIVLDVDSPGGSAQGNEELAQKIFAARGKKPIISVVQGMAASAAYYVASAADQIVVTESSEVGSIGVLQIHAESSTMQQRIGTKYTIIQAGEFKAAGNPYEALTAKTRGVLQERVDAFYEQFVGAVARHRGVSAAAVKADFGQGKVFLPAAAIQRGMADRVASLETILAELAPRPAASPPSRKESRPVNKRIKSALYALELVESAEAEDAVCEVALNAFCKTIKTDRPQNDAALLALLAKQFGGTAAASAAPVDARSDTQIEATKVEAAKAERARIADLTTRRGLLAEAGITISDEVFQASIDQGHDQPQAVDHWTRNAKKEKPINKPDITPTGSATDTFIAAATEAILDRVGMRRSDKPLSQEAQDLKRSKLMTMASFELKQRGVRVEGEPEDIAAKWLEVGGRFSIGSVHGSLQRAADFPHLLSNIAGKVLDQALEIAEATYPQWTAKIGDVADLKPHPVLAIGNFDELDRIGDDEKAKQLALNEEMPAWFQVDRFANKAGLTPVMVANDDLDLFTQQMQSLSIAHENTLNRMCVALLTGNVTMLDGNALFDNTNHMNDVASGGAAPSSTEYSVMRVKHRSQTGVGGKGKLRTPPKIVLVPTALETAAQTTTLPFANFSEMKVPVTDATLNPFRGKLVPVVEPELDASSALKWYTLCDPAIRRAICHVFQTGYGKGGQRISWFDPDTGTRWFRLEGRFAAFAGSWRGIVRNKGEA